MLRDIIQFENAATSCKSQQLLREILPYRSPIHILGSNSSKPINFQRPTCNWFYKRRCRAELVNISLNVLHQTGNHFSVMDNIELSLNKIMSLEQVEYLKNPLVNQRVTCLEVQNNQDPAMMEVLFSLLSSIRSLDIKASNVSQWMENIKIIGPCLRELTSKYFSVLSKTFITLTKYCPYLEKLCLSSVEGATENNFLQSIANNCPHLHSLYIHCLKYNTSAEADADLTAFAEKCPQLEELSLYCGQLTDQSVIALAQHCSRLKKLNLLSCIFIAALSERGLPLEEFEFNSLVIPSAEIAAQCAHTLSRIRKLHVHNGVYMMVRYALQYMTGLRELILGSTEDHLLVPHLLLLLQGQCCAGLESLSINKYSNITTEQFIELLMENSKLLVLDINQSICVTDAVLVELARSCPHLQKFAVYNISELTEQSVLALAVHCRQLREIYIPETKVSEETVRQLAQHCRHLTKLNLWVNVREGEVMIERYMRYSSKEIRALREIVRPVV